LAVFLSIGVHLVVKHAHVKGATVSSDRRQTR